MPTRDKTAGEADQEQSSEASMEARRKNLLACDATFQKWFGDRFDLATSRVVLATKAAERIVGDPLWVLIVGGPGTAKTETMCTLDAVGAEIVSTINSEGALLAGTEPPKDEAGVPDPEATGGLLRKLGAHGMLVIKDVTSILSMHHSSRAKILAALREIYDGYWSRYIGSRGGRTLVWEGELGLIGGVTTAWDVHHEVVSSMGDRFLLLRLNSDDWETRMAAGTQAQANNGKEGQMRRELRAAVRTTLDVFKPGHKALLDIPPGVEGELLTIANLTTMARTAVEYDRRTGGVLDAHAPEYPTRFAKQLGMLLRGGLAIGMTFAEALDLTLRVAQDSIPPMRRRILQDAWQHPGTSAKEASTRLGKPYMSVKREMGALQALGLLLMEEGNPQRYTLFPRWAPSVSSLFTNKVSTGGREGEDIEKAA